MNLEGKTILVTGSSSGIGRETALQLARERCRLILTYFKGKAAGEEVLKECLKHGEAALYRLDVRDDSSVRRLVKSVTDRFSRLDILINVAGVLAEKPLIEQSAEDTANQVGVNLLGLINVTRSFLPLLHRQKEAVIVNIASGLAKEVLPESHRILRDKVGRERFHPGPCPGTSRQGEGLLRQPRVDGDENDGLPGGRPGRCCEDHRPDSGGKAPEKVR